jgi:hypothetical protein
MKKRSDDRSGTAIVAPVDQIRSKISAIALQGRCAGRFVLVRLRADDLLAQAVQGRRKTFGARAQLVALAGEIYS